MNILYTAFEPFDNRDTNNSLEVMKGIKLNNKLIVKVSYNRCFDEIKRLIDKNAFDYIILTGEALSRTDITIEERAINNMNASIPDNDGIIYNGVKIDNNGRDYLYTTLVLDDLRLVKSNSAGEFVCNALIYKTLKYINDTNSNTKVTFIHIPRLEKYKSIDEITNILNEIINEIK